MEKSCLTENLSYLLSIIFQNTKNLFFKASVEEKSYQLLIVCGQTVLKKNLLEYKGLCSFNHDDTLVSQPQALSHPPSTLTLTEKRILAAINSQERLNAPRKRIETKLNI